MVGCFFAYHCSLIVRGKTTNETFKWQDYKDHCMEMARQSRCGATTALAWSINGNSMFDAASCTAHNILWVSELPWFAGQLFPSSPGSYGPGGVNLPPFNSKARRSCLTTCIIREFGEICLMFCSL